jgi:hypothetical protein
LVRVARVAPVLDDADVVQVSNQSVLERVRLRVVVDGLNGVVLKGFPAVVLFLLEELSEKLRVVHVVVEYGVRVVRDLLANHAVQEAVRFVFEPEDDVVVPGGGGWGRGGGGGGGR